MANVLRDEPLWLIFQSQVQSAEAAAGFFPLTVPTAISAVQCTQPSAGVDTAISWIKPSAQPVAGTQSFALGATHLKGLSTIFPLITAINSTPSITW